MPQSHATQLFLRRFHPPQRANIPAQQINLETRRSVGKPKDERANMLGAIIAVASLAKADTGIKIPTDQHDPFFSLNHSGAGVRRSFAVLRMTIS